MTEPTPEQQNLVNIDNENIENNENNLNLNDVTLKNKKLIKEILTDLVLNNTKIDEVKINLSLNNEFILFFKKIIVSYPKLLDELEESIGNIIEDKVLDVNDIPHLVVLIKNIYKKFNDKNNFKKMYNITFEDSVNFIKNILLILIELEHVKVNNKEKVISILDICIDLLSTSIELQDSIFNKLKSCFSICKC